MESAPFFSICLPAYEQVFFLKQTLNSIQKQLFTDYEIIFSDDSTSDEVFKLVHTYEFHGKLKYFRQIPSLGSPENWNFAISHANGKWIKILHHDDALFDEFTLQNLYVLALKTNKNWISGAPVHPSTSINRFCTVLLPRGLRLLEKYPGILAFGNCLGVPSVTLIKRECSKPYDKNLIWLVDVSYYLNLIHNIGFFEYYDKPLIWRNAGEHNLTNLYFNKPDVEINELLYIKKLMPKLFPFWLDSLIGAKLVRICHFAKITDNKQLDIINLEIIPFWLNVYFKYSNNNILQKVIVILSKIIFKLSSKIFGKFLMKGIQYKSM
jgi:glycosyltransferase involved in cell wall biosynthesis